MGDEAGIGVCLAGAVILVGVSTGTGDGVCTAEPEFRLSTPSPLAESIASIPQETALPKISLVKPCPLFCRLESSLALMVFPDASVKNSLMTPAL